MLTPDELKAIRERLDSNENTRAHNEISDAEVLALLSHIEELEAKLARAEKNQMPPRGPMTEFTPC